ncbi:Acyl-coenzyme A oxidase-like protein, partial [Myotis brandtii]
RYDLSLEETRALTFERVKFTLGLPLLRRAFQEQAEKTKNFVSRSPVIGEVLSTADMATAVTEFVIHTPCEDAEKMYIGNAMHGNYAVVFAQLLWLDGVKVRVCDPDGQYHSPIKNKSARFNVMLTPLRSAVTFQAIGAMKVADAH